MAEKNLLYADINNGLGGYGYQDAPAYYGEEDSSAASPGGLMYSNKGKLIFEGIDPKVGAIVWWWDFSQESQSPYAYVNSVLVCDSHSTSHISAYRVSASKGKSARIVMRLAKGGGRYFYPGNPCTHRIWKYIENPSNMNAQGFYNQKPNLRAQKAGSEGGGATFTISISSKGKIKFS